MPGDFTHLHLHTLYSLLDGAIRLPDLMKTCVDSGMKSVAVTDHAMGTPKEDNRQPSPVGPVTVNR